MKDDDEETPIGSMVGTMMAGGEPTHQLLDSQTGRVVGTYSSLKRASSAADRKDNEYGAVRYIVRPIAPKGG